MATTVGHIKDLGADCVYIGRANRTHSLPASKWANPFKIGDPDPGNTSRRIDRARAINLYYQYLLCSPDLLAQVPDLKGKVLGCWCSPKPCHGDILAEMADR